MNEKPASAAPTSELKKPRRRWSRYLLRVALAVVLLIGLGIGWIAMKAAKQRTAVDAILQGGGWVNYKYPIINWQSSWWESDENPAWVGFVHRMLDDNYFGVVVRAYVKTDSGLQRLNRLTELKSLTIDADQTNVNDHHVTDSGLERLRELLGLESLSIWGNGVTDDGLKDVGRLRDLKTLDFSNPLARTNVTNTGLAHLKGLSRLEHLGLWGAAVDDAGLEVLAGMHQLKSLNLAETKISDAGLDCLARLRQLQWLNVTNTKITDEGLQRLREALPNCKIVP